ncbi:MAG TPA: DUF1697 domain-containing protein [Croceibacterium sp.]
MTQYVALLGSINVGGNRLKMDELRAALEAEGFAKVQTVVASGNVLFEHDKEPDAALGQRISEVIKDRFGINSFAAVRSKAEIRSAIEHNPFAKDGERRFVHTIFLAEPLDRAAFETFAKAYDGPERLAAGAREFYVDYAEGVGRSKLDPAMAKAKPVKGRATARNLRSLQRILDKMD